MKIWPWQLNPMEIDPVPIVQEVGWAPRPVPTGAENLVPTLGFKPQTVQTMASSYTHVEVYRGSRGTAPHYHQH
jgi:hypothetical protein